MAARIKKGDEVVVISGRDKGKKGNVLKVMGDDNRVLVQGVHIVKRHERQTRMAAKRPGLVFGRWKTAARSALPSGPAK